MPRYEVRSLDVWGNSVDGYEQNNSHRMGTAFVPKDATDEQLIKILIEYSHLNREALQMYELGDLELEDQGEYIELSEAENEWHAIDERGDARILDADNFGHASEQLEEGEEAEEVVVHRPFMSLSLIYGRENTVPFFRQKVGGAVLEFRIDPEKPVRETKTGADFNIDSYVDGDFYDTFLLTHIDGEVIGVSKDDKEITGNEDMISHAKVALDAFLEQGGVGHPAFVPSKESMLSDAAKTVLLQMRLNDDLHNRQRITQEEYMEQSRKLWERARKLKVDGELAEAMSR